MKNIENMDEKTRKQLIHDFNESLSLAVTYRDEIANEDSIVLLKNLCFVAETIGIPIHEEHSQLFEEMKEHFQERS